MNVQILGFMVFCCFFCAVDRQIETDRLPDLFVSSFCAATTLYCIYPKYPYHSCPKIWRSLIYSLLMWQMVLTLIYFMFYVFSSATTLWTGLFPVVGCLVSFYYTVFCRNSCSWCIQSRPWSYAVLFASCPSGVYRLQLIKGHDFYNVWSL